MDRAKGLRVTAFLWAQDREGCTTGAQTMRTLLNCRGSCAWSCGTRVHCSLVLYSSTSYRRSLVFRRSCSYGARDQPRCSLLGTACFAGSDRMRGGVSYSRVAMLFSSQQLSSGSSHRPCTLFGVIMSPTRSRVLTLFLLLEAASGELHCTVSPTSKCFADFVDGKTRILAGDSFTTSGSQTKELCAASCKSMGFPVAGVEDGGECHCGTGYVSEPTLLPASKCSTACTGAGSETCGGTDALEIFTFNCTGQVTPNYKGCESGSRRRARSRNVGLVRDVLIARLRPTASSAVQGTEVL